MIAKFGIWEIDENFGLIANINNYNIAKESLWNTIDISGYVVWDWLIHLSEKKWITNDNYKDLVIAFLFAQDFFIKYKPKNTKDASTAQSIYLLQQYVEFEEDNKNDEFVNEPFHIIDKYLNKSSNIKFLNIT
ncbi:MAG: hypothetical protein ACOYMA_03745 [Bacteroidia bacterium]